CFLLLNHPNNLRLSKTALSHMFAPSWLSKLYIKVRDLAGGRSWALSIKVCHAPIDIETFDADDLCERSVHVQKVQLLSRDDVVDAWCGLLLPVVRIFFAHALRLSLS
ncbi:hypothetical protein, partial [Pararhodobacter oceanensis]|uniref:hypothetical protein n=1 Tax=Pararhodobacter oceanensis TaxID=2172121 RepID=UPI001981CCED